MKPKNERTVGQLPAVALSSSSGSRWGSASERLQPLRWRELSRTSAALRPAIHVPRIRAGRTPTPASVSGALTASVSRPRVVGWLPVDSANCASRGCRDAHRLVCQPIGLVPGWNGEHGDNQGRRPNAPLLNSSGPSRPPHPRHHGVTQERVHHPRSAHAIGSGQDEE